MLAPLLLHLPDEHATRALGLKLAALLQPGLTVHLAGELGSGKTTLARGIIRGLGFAGRVKSPSFALVEPYVDSRLSLYHFDFFRFKDQMEWQEAGLRECFNDRSICIVEWAEKAGGLLPPPDLSIRLAIVAAGRDATIDAGTETGQWCLTELARECSAR